MNYRNKNCKKRQKSTQKLNHSSDIVTNESRFKYLWLIHNNSTYYDYNYDYMYIKHITTA